MTVPNGRSVNELELTIREAFPDIRRQKKYALLTRQECMDMRTRLGSIDQEAIPYILPQVLIETLHNNDTFCCEFIVRYLNAGPDNPFEGEVNLSSEMAEGIEERLKHAEPGSSDYEEFSVLKKVIDAIEKASKIEPPPVRYDWRKEREAVFAQFTHQMNCAVYAWLDTANQWENMVWYEDEFKAAMAYWKTQCGQDAGGAS